MGDNVREMGPMVLSAEAWREGGVEWKRSMHLNSREDFHSYSNRSCFNDPTRAS